MGVNIGLIMARAVVTGPVPNRPLNESEAKAIFEPIQHFQLGCLYAMLVFVSFFFGVFMVLLLRYVTTAKTDTWWIKGLVTVVSVLIVGHAFYSWYLLHFLLVNTYGEYKQFLESDKYGWIVLLDAMISSMCQSFFAHRAYRLNGRNWFILILISASLAGGAATLGIFIQLPNMVYAAYEMFPAEMVWIVCAMAADMLITVSILYGLYKSRTGWRNTDRVIIRLIRMTLEAQVPVLVMTIIYLAVVINNSSDLLGAVFMGALPYFYAIGLLYSLNARQRWKPRNITMDNGGETFQASARQATTIQVDVHTETYESRVDGARPTTNRSLTDAKLDPINDAEWYDDENAYNTLNNTPNGTPYKESDTPPHLSGPSLV